jgi:hypothetical protein
MPTLQPAAGALLASLCLFACGDKNSAADGEAAGTPAAGGSGAGVAATYTSLYEDEGVLELKSNGTYVFTFPAAGPTNGTYTMDGEKILLNFNGQILNILKTGNCIQDDKKLLSKMCIGGRAGETADAGAIAPSGTWRATSPDGDFVLEFKPGNTLAVTLTPTGGSPETKEGTYTVEGRTIHARLGPGSDPMVLSFVNDAFETTSFGMAMKFVKQ